MSRELITRPEARGIALCKSHSQLFKANQGLLFQVKWIPWNLSFPCILFHEKRLQTMLWHHNARVNSHQRWKQTRNRICFHLWCELTSTMNVTEWQVSWNSCTRQLAAERASPTMVRIESRRCQKEANMIHIITASVTLANWGEEVKWKHRLEHHGCGIYRDLGCHACWNRK